MANPSLRAEFFQLLDLLVVSDELVLTNRLLPGPRAATTGEVVGARRKALEAGRNMVKGMGRVEKEARKERQMPMG